ncbi:MAG TPA: 16S rRNA (guanine(966)-N(2))-methyltransferase RsmD [Gemmatimonadaceae bacterium]|nr:16S rRNA (guanine(966)-N(2))-methyltransferase RsmD [Gemmatimonadaceae bacterium]
MRIVAGRWRGRNIAAPAGEKVRPTSDRVREAWMSIVSHDLPGATVLDLFAGSGALGLEALSRGAERADFVEVAAPSLAALRANVAALGAGEAAVVHRADALRFIAPLGAHAYDVAFADPPYKLGLAEQVAARWLETPFASLLGVEHFFHDRMPEGGETRRYGSTSITFYRADR